MAGKRIQKKMSDFIQREADLIAEYDTIEGVDLFDYCKYDAMDKIESMMKTDKSIDFKTVLSEALNMSIHYGQSLTDSLISIKLYEEYTKNKDKVVSMLNGIIIPDFLNQLVELIERKDYENAMFLYIKMTFLLMKRYKIHYYPLAIKPEEIDTNNLGHGYSLTRKINVF